MKNFRRQAHVAALILVTSLLFASCGGDDSTAPPPPTPGPGFKWQNPTPTGDAIRAIWGASTNIVYAVGNAGTLLRYNGLRWELQSQRLGTEVVWDIWGVASNNIFAVGDGGKIWNFNGSTWNEMDSGTTERLRGVYGFAPDAVFAVGDNGVVRQWNGSRWLPMTQDQNVTTANLIAIWGLSQNEFWVVTDDPTEPLIRFLSGGWSRVVIPPFNANDIWGTSNSNFFLVGSVGTVARFTQTGWEFSSPGGTETLLAINGFLNGSAVAVGTNSTILQWDGNDWSKPSVGPQSFDLLAVWGSNENDVHALGADGADYYYGGLAWVSNAQTVTNETLRSVTAQGNTAYAAGEDGVILNFVGGSWNAMTSGTSADLNSIYAVPQTTFAVGAGGVILQLQAGWTPLNSGVTDDLTGVWALSDSSAVAVGPSAPLYFNGASWAPMNTNTDASDMLAVWGTAEDNVVAVGKNGRILRYNGAVWDEESSPVVTTLRSVYGTGANDIYAAGDNGRVLHWDGIDWTDVMGAQFQVDLHAVTVSSVFGVYAVGDLGAICLLTNSGGGTQASRAAAPTQQWVEVPYTNQSQRGATVDAAGNVFFCGLGGTIIRWGQ